MHAADALASHGSASGLTDRAGKRFGLRADGRVT